MNRNRPVCKFFLQGRCKYGNSCVNYHPPRDGGSGGGGGGGSGGGSASAVGGIELPNANSQEVRDRAKEIKDMLGPKERPAWPLTSFGLSEEPCIVQGTDISFEEARFACYTNFQAAMAELAPMIAKCQAQFQKALDNPVPSAQLAVLKLRAARQAAREQDERNRQLGITLPPPPLPPPMVQHGGSNMGGGFGSVPAASGFGAQAAASGFGAQAAASGFGAQVAATGSAFSTQQQQQQQQQQQIGGAFGQPLTLGAPAQRAQPSPFGAPAQPSAFGPTPAAAPAFDRPSAFGAAASGQQPSAFAQPAPATSGSGRFVAPHAAAAAAQTGFGVAPAAAVAAAVPSAFGRPIAPATISAAAAPAPAIAAPPLGTAPPPGDLTEDDVAAYRAAQFELGKIPVHPPPRELC